MEILLLISGIVIGIIGTWFVCKFKFQKEKGISIDEINKSYINKDVYNDLKEELQNKDNDLINLNKLNAELLTNNKNLTEQLEKNRKEIDKIYDKFINEFENLSNKILDDKGKKLIELNQDKLKTLLNPLKDKIKDFEAKVAETYDKETRDKISLKKEIESLLKLNQQLSDDAKHLTSALKGDSKVQGDWGELQLEMILQKAGLEKDIHYKKQETLKDEFGKNIRPDYIVNLPDNKNIIID